MTFSAYRFRFWRYLFFVGIFSLVACTHLPKSESNAQDSEQERQLREYHELRLVQGHFGGGVWNDKVDRFNGRKHHLMKALAVAAERETWSVDDLYRRFGKPDLTPRTDDSLQGRLESALAGLQTGDALAAYFWRGNHDVLIFYHRTDGSLAHTWWYAGE